VPDVIDFKIQRRHRYRTQRTSLFREQRFLVPQRLIA
jgi:hypothetical protein